MRRIFKTWEWWVLAALIWLAAMAKVQYASSRGSGYWPYPANYFDQYDWGIDDRGGIFYASWGAFGFHHARERPWFGFQFVRGDNWPESGNGWYWYIRIPFWAPALLLIPATIRNTRRFGRWVLTKQFPAGCCQKCGYDLRATPDRCPECGTPVDISPTD